MTTDRYAAERERQVPFAIRRRLSAQAGSVVLPPAALRRLATLAAASVSSRLKGEQVVAGGGGRGSAERFDEDPGCWLG